ncbi:MAG: stalk domain-containing protein [Capsulimonadaceae bacterium]
MNMENNIKAAIGTMVAVFALWPAASAVANMPVSVDVDGAPVSFSGSPPVETKGAVLVPLRGVFQAMGASVSYDPDTRTIEARKGASRVVLPLGSPVATLNGRSEEMSQPAVEVNGTTLVPLRFVAQALGAYVEWHQTSNTVEIRTLDSHLSALPPLPPGTITGQLTGVYIDANPPMVTVRIEGDNTHVPASSNVDLARLRIGDQVSIRVGPDGAAESITANHGKLTGTVKSIGNRPNGQHLVTLNDGTAVMLVANATYSMDGCPIDLTNIMPDEHVTIRTNHNNTEAYSIMVMTGDDSEVVQAGSHRTASSYWRAPSSEQPAVGHAASAAGGPTISAFDIDVDTDQTVHTGDVLNARLTGSPGGQATMTIPGVVGDVTMNEVDSGVYRAHIDVPATVALNGATAVAMLTLAGHQSPLIRAPEKLVVDSLPPLVTSVCPAVNATVETSSPLIYATVTDNGGTGIDPIRTQVSIDDRDVTEQSTITQTFIDVKPASLMPGRHTVQISLVDQAGNQTENGWNFDVSADRTIASFQTDVPPGSLLSTGSAVHFTVMAPRGGSATASVKGLCSNIPLTETQPGLYVGSYTVLPGQEVTEAPIAAQFTSADGNVAWTDLSSGLNVSAGVPDAPEITSPVDGDAVTDQVHLSGTAPAGTTVKIDARYLSSLPGNILPVSGDLGAREAMVDDSGQWSIDSVPLHADNLLGSGRDTQYAISAVIVDPSGSMSRQAVIMVQGGHAHRSRAGRAHK